MTRRAFLLDASARTASTEEGLVEQGFCFFHHPRRRRRRFEESEKVEEVEGGKKTDRPAPQERERERQRCRRHLPIHDTFRARHALIQCPFVAEGKSRPHPGHVVDEERRHEQARPAKRPKPAPSSAAAAALFTRRSFHCHLNPHRPTRLSC